MASKSKTKSKTEKKNSKVCTSRPWEHKETLRCRFCGGKQCLRCGDNAYTIMETPPAFEKFHSSWITPDILAMQRPSDEIMDNINLISLFVNQGITAIFNLTEPGEHPYCGYGLKPSGFSYTPERFMDAGIKHFNYSWRDMTTPSMPLMLDIVQVAVTEIRTGGKIAVHCHAGFGRTGICIAAILMALTNSNASETIQLIRSRRPKSVQTKKQEKFVRHFELLYRALCMIFVDIPPQIAQATNSGANSQSNGNNSNNHGSWNSFNHAVTAGSSHHDSRPRPTSHNSGTSSAGMNRIRSLFGFDYSIISPLEYAAIVALKQNSAALNDTLHMSTTNLTSGKLPHHQPHHSISPFKSTANLVTNAVTHIVRATTPVASPADMKRSKKKMSDNGKNAKRGQKMFSDAASAASISPRPDGEDNGSDMDHVSLSSVPPGNNKLPLSGNKFSGTDFIDRVPEDSAVNSIPQFPDLDQETDHNHQGHHDHGRGHGHNQNQRRREGSEATSDAAVGEDEDEDDEDDAASSLDAASLASLSRAVNSLSVKTVFESVKSQQLVLNAEEVPSYRYVPKVVVLTCRIMQECVEDSDRNAPSNGGASSKSGEKLSCRGLLLFHLIEMNLQQMVQLEMALEADVQHDMNKSKSKIRSTSGAISEAISSAATSRNTSPVAEILEGSEMQSNNGSPPISEADVESSAKKASNSAGGKGKGGSTLMKINEQDNSVNDVSSPMGHALANIGDVQAPNGCDLVRPIPTNKPLAADKAHAGTDGARNSGESPAPVTPPPGSSTPSTMFKSFPWPRGSAGRRSASTDTQSSAVKGAAQGNGIASTYDSPTPNNGIASSTSPNPADFVETLMGSLTPKMEVLTSAMKKMSTYVPELFSGNKRGQGASSSLPNSGVGCTPVGASPAVSKPYGDDNNSAAVSDGGHGNLSANLFYSPSPPGTRNSSPRSEIEGSNQLFGGNGGNIHSFLQSRTSGRNSTDPNQSQQNQRRELGYVPYDYTAVATLVAHPSNTNRNGRLNDQLVVFKQDANRNIWRRDLWCPFTFTSTNGSSSLRLMSDYRSTVAAERIAANYANKIGGARATGENGIAGTSNAKQVCVYHCNKNDSSSDLKQNEAELSGVSPADATMAMEPGTTSGTYSGSNQRVTGQGSPRTARSVCSSSAAATATSSSLQPHHPQKISPVERSILMCTLLLNWLDTRHDSIFLPEVVEELVLFWRDNGFDEFIEQSDDALFGHGKWLTKRGFGVVGSAANTISHEPSNINVMAPITPGTASTAALVIRSPIAKAMAASSIFIESSGAAGVALSPGAARQVTSPNRNSFSSKKDGTLSSTAACNATADAAATPAAATPAASEKPCVCGKMNSIDEFIKKHLPRVKFELFLELMASLESIYLPMRAGPNPAVLESMQFGVLIVLRFTFSLIPVPYRGVGKFLFSKIVEKILILPAVQNGDVSPRSAGSGDSATPLMPAEENITDAVIRVLSEMLLNNSSTLYNDIVPHRCNDGSTTSGNNASSSTPLPEDSRTRVSASTGPSPSNTPREVVNVQQAPNPRLQAMFLPNNTAQIIRDAHNNKIAKTIISEVLVMFKMIVFLLSHKYASNVPYDGRFSTGTGTTASNFATSSVPHARHIGGVSPALSGNGGTAAGGTAMVRWSAKRRDGTPIVGNSCGEQG